MTVGRELAVFMLHGSNPFCRRKLSELSPVELPVDSLCTFHYIETLISLADSDRSRIPKLSDSFNS